MRRGKDEGENSGLALLITAWTGGERESILMLDAHRQIIMISEAGLPLTLVCQHQRLEQRRNDGRAKRSTLSASCCEPAKAGGGGRESGEKNSGNKSKKADTKENNIALNVLSA